MSDERPAVRKLGHGDPRGQIGAGRRRTLFSHRFLPRAPSLWHGPMHLAKRISSLVRSGQVSGGANGGSKTAMRSVGVIDTNVMARPAPLNDCEARGVDAVLRSVRFLA